MTTLLQQLSSHGYLVLAAVCFAEAIGLPLPATLAILTAGALAAFGNFHLYWVFATAWLALLSGDIVLYFLGRFTGWALLGILCRLSANPETCILRSAEYFYRRGKQTLLFAKFIPGVNTMSPPLAGSMNMPLGQFVQFDAAGAALYAGAYCLAGNIFSNGLRTITHALHSAGSVAEVVLGIGLLFYIGYRIWIYRKYRILDVAPRVTAEEVGRRFAADEGRTMLIADVRSHGYYSGDSERIAGSIRIEPNNLAEEIKKLSPEQEIYLYCTCMREATSARVAHLLMEKGFKAYVISGGLRSWRKAGHAVEAVPHDDLVKLPTFS